jgi:hypothetical protein
MKHKKKGKICFVIYIAGESNFNFVCEVIEEQTKKRPANHYCRGFTLRVALLP